MIPNLSWQTPTLSLRVPRTEHPHRTRNEKIFEFLILKDAFLSRITVVFKPFISFSLLFHLFSPHPQFYFFSQAAIFIPSPTTIVYPWNSMIAGKWWVRQLQNDFTFTIFDFVNYSTQQCPKPKLQILRCAQMGRICNKECHWNICSGAHEI